MSVSTLSNTYTTVFAQDDTTQQVVNNDENNSDTSEDETTSEADEDVNVQKNDVEESENIQEQLGDSNILEYFLVDQPILNTPNTQNFVLSLSDVQGLSDFSITVQKNDGSTFDLDSNEQVDGLIKFSKNFSSADQGEYTVTKLHYLLNNEKYYLDFKSLDMNIKFGVDQEYTGYDSSLPDLTQESQDEELQDSVIQVTDLNNTEEEVANGIASNSSSNMSIATFSSEIATQSNEGITICLDAGHGGNDGGAVGVNGALEKNLTLKITQYCKEELEKYNCNVVMTRTGDTNPSLEERADIAKNYGASYLISFHLNSASSQAQGAEVYYPNNHWRSDISTNGAKVAQAIQNQLVSLGLVNRGIKIKTIDENIYKDPYRYDDGSVADYYGIIRNAKYNGLTGLIIEHCFINNASDYNKYLSSDEKLKALGVADANGIIAALGLSKKVASTPNSSVTESVLYQTHVQTYGWQSWKKNGEMSGTSGESKRLEGINIKLSDDLSGNIEYQTHVQTYGWQGWKKNGEMSGTSGESKRLEGIKIRLTGEVANQYDVYYRVHAQTFGWLGWAKNGECAGSEGYSKRLEGIQIVLVKKGSNAPGSTERPFVCKMVKYQTHVQTYGWQAEKADGETSGTTGQSKRLESINVKLSDSIDGGIQYKTHVQTYGWQNWVTNGQNSGTTGQSKRLEAIQIQLTGNAANEYDIYYRVHAQHFGWLGWAKNGQSAGTSGYSYRLEGIQIVLVKKGQAAPSSTSNVYYKH